MRDHRRGLVNAENALELRTAMGTVAKRHNLLLWDPNINVNSCDSLEQAGFAYHAEDLAINGHDTPASMDK
jgi:hypothetical protein